MRILLIIICAFIAVAAGAQGTFGYADIAAGKFTQKTVAGVRSMADGEHYTVNAGGRAIEKYSYKTGRKVATVYESQAPFNDYCFSPDERKILIITDKRSIYRHSATATHWVYDIAAKRLTRLTEEGREQEATFSPDGRRIAFVRDNNLFYVELADGSLHHVTRDGERNRIIHGHTDWVYEEEFGFTRAFEFSPDSQSIAWLRFNETAVPEFTMMRFAGRTYPEPYTFKYPVAGAQNSTVELHTYNIKEGRRAKADVGPEADQYIPRIGWTPVGRLFFYRENRLQNHFEVIVVEDGASKVLYNERDERYVELPDNQTVTFLADGRFVVRSERGGYAHLYLHDAKGAVTDTLTRGEWEVRRVVDVTGDRVFFLSNEGSPLRNNLWSVRLDGSKKQRLTHDEGTFAIAPSRGFKYFISTFSNITTPRLVRLHDASGRVVRTLEENAALKRTIQELNVPQKEFFAFETSEGVSLNGWMLRPRDFDPAKKYPVLMFQYSGPGSQEVVDRWKIDWYDALVQRGYVVACVDGRGTGGRGAGFRKCTYGNLGELETIDQIEAGKYLASQPWADPARIGIYGWSFGGFMALNCILKGSEVFSAAVSVAPVTSWRFYDSVYTEVYNGLPQDNPRGYDDNSPLNFAGRLEGRLLIAHGTGDDNVHIQNTYLMASALTAAGKQFDMHIYPDDNHSMYPHGRQHVERLMVDWVTENL
jgi:dipeptidyl-peptidase-4